MGNTSMPIHMQMPNDSVSCLDPFADEPYHKSHPNQQQMPYSGMPPNSDAHDSSSPMPTTSGAMPPYSSSMMLSSGAAMQSGHPPAHNAMALSVGSPYSAPNSTPAYQGSYMPLHSNSMPMNGGPMPPAPSQGSDYPPQSQAPGLDVPPPSMVMSQNSGMPPNSQYNDTGAMTSVFNASMQPNIPMFSEQPMYHQSQDSNSNSSLPDYSGPGTGQSGGLPGMDVSSSQFSNAANASNSTVRQFPFGDNKFSKPERFDQGSPSMSHAANMPMSQAPMMNQPPMGMTQAGPMGPQGPMVPGQNMMGSQQPTMGPMGPQGSMGQQGPMQGPMTYQQSGSMAHGYMNPQQQPGMDQDQGHSGLYGNQAPDQYGQGNYHNRMGTMMKNDQYPGYQRGQYGSQPMPGYSTPNKMYPDNREDFNLPVRESSQLPSVPITHEPSTSAVSGGSTVVGRGRASLTERVFPSVSCPEPGQFHDQLVTHGVATDAGNVAPSGAYSSHTGSGGAKGNITPKEEESNASSEAKQRGRRQRKKEKKKENKK